MAVNDRVIAEMRMRRALVRAAGARLRRRRKVPLQQWPRAARVEYVSALRSAMQEVEQFVRQYWFPRFSSALLTASVAKPAGAVRLDAADDFRDSTAPAAIVEEVLGEDRIGRVVRQVARRTAEFNKGQLNRQYNATLGIELLQNEPYLQQQLEAFALDNVRLVRGLAQDELQKMQGLVLKAIRTGTPASELQAQIEARFDRIQGRAELIARDQIGSLNAELTQLRQTSVGVEEYEWSTAKDERVRPSHRALEGSSHRWDDPPSVDGEKAHPGQPINCRCVAIPKVDDLLARLAA